jgi:hypothetical protein
MPGHEVSQRARRGSRSAHVGLVKGIGALRSALPCVRSTTLPLENLTLQPPAQPPLLDAVLLPAYRLLRSAYPDGMPQADYRAVLSLLYDHFSDRNLAALIAAFTGKAPEIVLNDLYGCAGAPVPPSVKARLAAVDFPALCSDD